MVRRGVSPNLFQLGVWGTVSSPVAPPSGSPVGSGALPQRQTHSVNNIVKINLKSGLSDCNFYLCRKANLLSNTEEMLFIDCNLQIETLLMKRGDVACDVMSRLSDPHLRKLATYDLHS